MKRGFRLAGLLLLCTALPAATAPGTVQIAQQMNSMPLAFTKNMGQWDDRVLFRANVGGATMWFTKEGVTYQFTRRIENDNTFPSPLRRGARGVSEKDSIEQLVLTAKFLGANVSPEVIVEGLLEYRSNYLLGNDPAKWRTDVPSYREITLKQIYPGIDLKYSGDGRGQAVYEFLPAPGADIARVEVEYEGTMSTSIDDPGNLILKTRWGDLIAGLKSPVNGVLSGSCACRAPSSTTSSPDLACWDALQTRAPSDSPSVGLIYSTFLGGSERDWCTGIAIDALGAAYVTGVTCSADFPMRDPYQGTFLGGTVVGGECDAFVTKLSSTGSSLLYSTYLGGTGDDMGNDIVVDASGAAYIVGRTNSDDFPTLDPYQGTYHGNWDVFVSKLSASGSDLIYSTYLGGTGFDFGYGIDVDDSEDVYLAGYGQPNDFPTVNAYQATAAGDWDAFVTKLSRTGSSLVYSTLLGGNGEDYCFAIAVDGFGAAYVTGQTRSTNFPIQNQYQTDQDSIDAFITKFSSSGSNLVYSTYLGGNGEDYGFDIVVDALGAACVTGRTSSTDFPLLNAYQVTCRGSADAYVTKLSSSGDNLIYSTYLGGTNVDWGMGIASDDAGAIYMIGSTSSSDFPTKLPIQAAIRGDWDVFVAKFSGTGDYLIYSTYLGGIQWEENYGDIAADAIGAAYVAGRTHSVDFPTLNPYQGALHGFFADAFVAKLSGVCEDADADGICDPTDNCTGVQNHGQEDYDQDGMGDVCDSCNNFHPVVTLNAADTLVRFHTDYAYYPRISDAEGGSFAISYLQHPHWCSVRNDSVVGLAPDTAFAEMIRVEVRDTCNTDTISVPVTVYLCGNANGDDCINISDAVYLIAYIFAGGSAPAPLLSGDANCDGTVNISDAVYLIAYIFAGGLAPCAGC